jgi:hypothetical protein
MAVCVSLALAAFVPGCGGADSGGSAVDGGSSTDGGGLSNADSGASNADAGGGGGGTAYWLLVQSDDIQVDLLSDSATIWGVPVTDTAGVNDLSGAVRLYDGEVFGYAGYADVKQKPTVSGDGNWVAFRDETDPTWYIVPIDGSADPTPVDGQVHWAPTGSRYFIGNGSSLTIRDAATGDEVVSASYTTGGAPSDWVWARDASALLVLRSDFDAGTSTLMSLVDDGSTSTIVDAGDVTTIALSADASRIIYASGDRAWVADIDGQNATDVADAPRGLLVAPSRDRVLACDVSDNCVIVTFDGSTQALSAPTGTGGRAWAPDGSTLFLSNQDDFSLVSVDTTTGAVTPLGTFMSVNYQASATGAWILASVDYDGPWQAIPSDGGTPTALTDADGIGITTSLWNGDDEVTWIGTDLDGQMVSGSDTLTAGASSQREVFNDAVALTLRIHELQNTGRTLESASETHYGLGDGLIVHYVFVDADLLSTTANEAGNGTVDKSTIEIDIAYGPDHKFKQALVEELDGATTLDAFPQRN